MSYDADIPVKEDPKFLPDEKLYPIIFDNLLEQCKQDNTLLLLPTELGVLIRKIRKMEEALKFYSDYKKNAPDKWDNQYGWYEEYHIMAGTGESKFVEVDWNTGCWAHDQGKKACLALDIPYTPCNNDDEDEDFIDG